MSFVEASTGNQPVVIQLSDLHWADAAVVELIDVLLERLARRPYVLVATARQGIRERWSPSPGRHNAIVVNLDPLEAPAASELLESLVGWSLPDDVRDALLDRSGGNPFFLEELVALLGEREAAEGFDGVAPTPELHALPTRCGGWWRPASTASAPTSARCSPTPRSSVAEARSSTSAASTSTSPAASTSTASMAELVAKELFQLDGGHWSFRSDLVREVAYNTLTKGDRAKLHAGIAMWIEKHHEGEWSDGTVDQLAHHYGVAAELADDLGGASGVPDDVCEKAVRWISEAADRARRGELLAVAERLATQALGLVGPDPSIPRLELLLCRGRGARRRVGPRRRARPTPSRPGCDADALGETSLGARALLVLGDVAQKSGQAEVAVQHPGRGGRSLRRPRRRPRPRPRRCASRAWPRCSAASSRPPTRRSRPRWTRSGRSGSASGEAWALQNLAWIAFTKGRTDEAERRLDAAVATFRELGDGVGIAWAQGLLAFVKFQQGDREAAERLGHQILVEARGRGDRWATAMMLVLAAGLHLWAGRTDEAVIAAGEADAIFARLGDAYGRSQSVAAHARALMMVGQVDEGIAAFEGGDRARPTPGPTPRPTSSPAARSPRRSCSWATPTRPSPPG